MSQAIHERLNQIPERILSTEFMTGQGLGNEIGFWIFGWFFKKYAEKKQVGF